MILNENEYASPFKYQPFLMSIYWYNFTALADQAKSALAK